MSACQCNVEECILCEGRLFEALDRAQVCDVRDMISRRTFLPREVLFREGDPSEHLLVIRSGYVKLSTGISDGREQILRIAVIGNLLGFEAFESHVYRYNAEAVTEVMACQIRHKDMMGVLEQNPTVAVQVIRMLNEENEGCRNLVRDLGLKNSTERIASFILSLIPMTGARDAELLMPLCRREIAEMLGLTPETVCRLMAKFRRDGLIDELPGRIRIVDFKRLKNMAGSGLLGQH